MSEEKTKKPLWKRWWVWLIAVVVIIVIAASRGGGNQSQQASTGGGGGGQQQSQQAYKLNEEAKAGNLSYVVSEVKTATSIGPNEYLQKKTDNQFVLVKVKVTNNDKESRIIDTNLFKLKDKDGKEYSAAADADMYANDNVSFFLQQVNPGTNRSGYIVFETPKGVSGLKLQVSSGLGWSGGQYATIDLGM